MEAEANRGLMSAIYWRERAEEKRALADGMVNLETKALREEARPNDRANGSTQSQTLSPKRPLYLRLVQPLRLTSISDRRPDPRAEGPALPNRPLPPGFGIPFRIDRRWQRYNARALSALQQLEKKPSGRASGLGKPATGDREEPRWEVAGHAHLADALRLRPVAPPSGS